MRKCVITVVGKDNVGIIAEICAYLAERGINILDISQTTVQGYFNMMMIADISNADREFKDMEEDLERIGERIGVSVRCQRAEIFEKMHRL